MAQTMLVIGGAGGVGLETCRLAQAKGYDVITTVLNEAERAAVLDAIPSIARVAIVDLADGDAAAEKLKAICASIEGELKAAICCAGFARSSPVELAPLSDFRLMLEVNTIANVSLYQASIDKLRESRGNLVLISSLGGKYVTPMFGYYSASKYALEAMVDAMRREASRWGVGIVAVQPGWIRTGMANGHMNSIPVQIANMNETQRAHYGAFLEDMRRIGESMDDAGMEPVVVATKIIEVAEMDSPDPRYIVGDDAVEVIRRSREWTDAEIDRDFYTQLPSLAGA